MVRAQTKAIDITLCIFQGCF